MHNLLIRQLKKTNYKETSLNTIDFKSLLDLVNQSYIDNDEDRNLLENTLTISSIEMQDLYKQLKEKSDNELKRNQEKYERLINGLKNYYYFYTNDKDGTFISVSDSVENILGYKKDDFINNYFNYLSNDDINKKASYYSSLSKQGLQQKPFIISIKDINNNIFYFEITEIIVFDDNNKVECIDSIARNITDQYLNDKIISFRANHDILTGLVNRYNLEKCLENIIYESSRKNSTFALLYLDLDKFKYINDTYGHDVGDFVLKEFTKRIQPNIRSIDTFARIGGDEFVIVLNDINNEFLSNIINKIISLIAKPWSINNINLNISSSIGIALYPKDGKEMNELMKNADTAMYKSKTLGRNTFTFFTDTLNQKIHTQILLEEDLNNSINLNQLILYYQPKQELLTNNIVEIETLLRWEHPKLGLLRPEKFIQIAKNINFIDTLDTWVIKEACKSLNKFKKYNNGLNLSINISIEKLLSSDIYDVLADSLYINKIKKGQLTLEISHDIINFDIDICILKFKKISSLGINICIDNLNISNTNLEFLSKLKIDSFKVHKKFINELKKDINTNSTYDLIMAISNAMNIKVFVQGIEKEYQREYLIKKGYLYYQGYLFSKAIKEKDLIKLLSKNN